MAYCGEASLDATYLQLLSSVAAGGPDGAGNLALETAGGAQRMLFKNGGAPQDATPSESSADMIQPQQVSIDTQGLPYSWQANLVPETPYDASQPPGPMGLPEHIEINFGVTDPADRQPGDPIMNIIPVTAYEQMWDAAGNPSVTATITKIYSSTVAIQSPPPTSGLPALPPEQITGYNDLAVQIGRAQSDVDSASRSGYRFVGRWAQDANPVTAESRLWYTYQGFTNDGQYLVNFFYPVTTAKLPKQADLTTADWDKFNSDPQAYIKAQAEMLNALAPADWQPDLSQLDALVGSLRIQGMPRSGLHDVVWQWTGSTYQGKENPIADPSLYRGRVRLGRHAEREGGLQSGERHVHLRRRHGRQRPCDDGTLHPGRLRPRLPLGGVDQQPHGRAGLPRAARRQRAEAQHARRRSRLELPSQRRGDEVRRDASPRETVVINSSAFVHAANASNQFQHI